VVAVKHIITVHDNFFLVKSLSSSSEINKFISKFNYYTKCSSLSTTRFKGFSHKVNFSHSRRQFFFLSFQKITMLLHLLLVVLTVLTLIIRVLINLTILTPIIAIDYYIVKNINYSLYVLAGI